MANKFVIVTQDNCQYCDKAKALLTEKGFTFGEVVAGNCKELMTELELTTVPQIWYGKVYIGGYQELVGAIDFMRPK